MSPQSPQPAGCRRQPSARPPAPALPALQLINKNNNNRHGLPPLTSNTFFTNREI